MKLIMLVFGVAFIYFGIRGLQGKLFVSSGWQYQVTASVRKAGSVVFILVGIAVSIAAFLV